jgi:eukaryotic-like serine/threonine-protein kinase
MAIDQSQRDDLLDRLVDEFAGRLRRGEQPSLKDYTDRYPDLADEILELFPAMVKVEQVKEICHDWDEAKTRTQPLSQVGDYRIIREIGRGGMGVVYEAEQISLGRRVALKVLPWQVAKDRTTLERFRREARASARLHHTNIVPVFEVGQDGDVRYYAMQFIQGQSLDSVIDELRRLRGRSPAVRGNRPAPADEQEAHRADSATRGDAAQLRLAQTLLSGRFDQGSRVVADAPAARVPEASPPGSVGPESVPPMAPDTSAVMPGGAQLSSVESRHRAFHRGVAHIGRQAASALAHAHARGIVHRDVKPSNLLLDTEGVVWVSDFGLAKVDEDDLTRTGDILGTLRYMAPERFRGRGDARADLYSLGLTLYELLVLRPAFDSPDRVALSEQIKTVEPPRPRSIDPRVPRDLETIVLKAIEKNPNSRYPSAEPLAEDLRRFLDDQPILARRVGAAERYLRWARRNPVIAVLGGILTTVLVLATVASVLAAGRMASLLRQNDADRREADRQRDRAERSLYAARISLAENALRSNDPATAAKLLDQYRPGSYGPDRRGWEWSYLDRWCRPELRTLRIPGAVTIFSLDVSPDGRFLVAVGGNPYHYAPAYTGEPATVHVYDLPGLTLRRTLAGHWDKANTVAFRPDGKRLAIAASDGRVTLWDARTWQTLRTFEGGITENQPGRVEILGWSPDGRRLALRIEESVWIGDPETMHTTARIAEAVESLTWSPDGKRIAAITGPRGVQIRDAENGRRLGPPLEASGVVRRLFWGPPGQRLTGFCTDGTRKTWDLATGHVVEDKAIVPELVDVVSSHDGSFFVSGGKDGLLRVVDTASGNVMATLFHGANSIRALALSPDGSRLFVGGLGLPGVKVFDPRRDPCGRIAPAQWQLCALAFDDRGEKLRTINWEGGSDGANLEIHDITGGKPQPGPRLPVSNQNVYPRADFAFAPDGQRLAAPKNGEDSSVGVWDVVTGTEIATLRAPGTVSALAFGAEGGRLAIGAWDRRRNHAEVAIWDLAIGRVIQTIDAGPHPIQAVAFSADGQRVAAGGGGDRQTDDSGWAVVWDSQTGAPLIALDRAGIIKALVFDPNGIRFAAADLERETLHIWDLRTGTEIRRPAPAAVSCLAFSPDGRRLASVGYDGQVHLADAQTGEELLVLRSAARPSDNAGFTPRLTFSRDGLRLAANGLKDVSFWEISAPTGPDPPLVPPDVAGWLRQGRALADRGDAPGAEATYARARELDDGDPSPWIEHALSLWRRGDSPQARDALARAMRSLPDDPGQWTDLGRLLGRFGWMQESETARAKARSLAEQRLSRAPDDEAAIAALAEALPDVGGWRGWTVIQPDVMTSVAGATLSGLPDGSVLAGGLNPLVDTYTVEAVITRAGITGLRLEALTDPSLPHFGPGRCPEDGNFHLEAIRLSTVPELSAPVPVHLTRARADYSDPGHGFRDVSGAIDADPTTLWSIGPRIGRPHWAIFQAARPIGHGRGLRLRVDLDCGLTKYPYHALGRFRLAVTNQSVPFFEPSVMRIKSDPVRNGLTRLGAAYFLLGDWAAAASILERAAERPDATALDGFLLALARHRLGRHAEARSDCDRAVERLRTNAAGDETRDVALEAIATIRDLSVGDAELLLLDAAFPAAPFAR